MSYDPDNPFTEGEIREALGVQDLSPEDVFSMVLINKAKMVKVRVELQDKDGEKIPLYQVIDDLLKYILKKTTEEAAGNQFVDQIMPLMSQMLVSGLGRYMGIKSTAFYLGNDQARHAFIQMMGLSFLFLKYMQTKGLSITTIEEPVTEVEVASIERKSKANSVAMVGSAMGMDYKDIIKQMVKQGQLTQDDIKDLLREDERVEVDDTDEPEGSESN